MVDDYRTELEIAAPPEQVFRHLTEPASMVRWMGQHAALEAHPGGRFEVDIDGIPVRGAYLVVEEPTRVVVSWGVAGNDEFPVGSSEVEFLLTRSPGGTLLRLTHRNLPERLRPMHAEGWGLFLGRLAEAAAAAGPRPDGPRPEGDRPEGDRPEGERVEAEG